MRVSKYFTLYFIPLFPIDNLGEYVQCQTCKQMYKPEVLSYEPPSPEVRLILSIRADLESGTPIQFATRKMVNAGVDPATAERLVGAASNHEEKTCAACNLTYLRSVAHCASCGANLATQAGSLPNRTDIKA